MATEKITILDGAMGTMLQRTGLRLGQRPETLCVTAPETVMGIHRAYIEAGAQMILSNTFCANRHKLEGTGFAVGDVVRAAVRIAKQACEGSGCRVALDIGPIGELLEPLGTLAFDEAYELFREMIEAGRDAGADAVYFETFSDLSELRAGVLAAKENCDLPVFASMTFESTGRTFLGCRADAAAMTLAGLGVSAVGVNCSLGPKEVAPILARMRSVTDLPLILKPNAGLPDPKTGAYHMSPSDFAKACAALLDLGAAYIGGCCGTTPEFIRALCEEVGGKSVSWEGKQVHGICSAHQVCAFGGIRVIGERINPTGKKRFARALEENDLSYIVSQAVEQQEAGAQILDINVGLPGIDEAAMMKRVVTAVGGVCELPLQIDSSNPAVIEAGLRSAPGKCLINSVNATKESLDAVLPLARKYGAAVVGLTLGGGGLPESAQERVNLAEKIIAAAQASGIPREDIAIDCLTLTVSAQQDQARATLEALAAVRRKFGVETVLGVSNISFGLPQRQHVTQAFLTQALCCGLTLPIVNPNNDEVMHAISACRVLSGEDEGCAQYIQRHAQSGEKIVSRSGDTAKGTIAEAIEKGLKHEAGELARELLKTCDPLELVQRELIPALDRVGEAYERQEVFLPQLMNAAAASGAAFDEVKKAIAQSGEAKEEQGVIVMATVEGDIHDIGKNIVSTVLINYGCRVIDLGRDVKAERVVEAAKMHNADMIGLSALMTTTVPGMERTIRALRSAGIDAPVIVGGAVLTPEYAAQIGADYYAKDAKQCADIVRRVLAQGRGEA